MDTDALIAQLATTVGPVHRLPAPWVRMLLWLALSVPFVAGVVWLMPSEIDLATAIADRRFLIEQAITLVAALAAALAAFCSVVPGYDRRVLLLPLGPLAAWLASIGQGCWRDWIAFGVDGLRLRSDWACLPPAILIGIVPAIVMVMMLRRGAPLVPRMTIALGTLAVAALANLGLQLFHVGDASIMILFWHFGGAAVLAALAGSVGRRVLHWRHAAASR